MKAVLKGWNFMRLLRVGLGVAILVQGIITKDVMSIVLGIIFGGMAVANIGCCGANGCDISRPSAGKIQRKHYEEMDNK
jgi:hypothetical protein